MSKVSSSGRTSGSQSVQRLCDVQVTPATISAAATYFLKACVVCAIASLAGADGVRTCVAKTWTLRGIRRSTGSCKGAVRCLRCQASGHISTRCGTFYVNHLCFSCLRYQSTHGSNSPVMCHGMRDSKPCDLAVPYALPLLVARELYLVAHDIRSVSCAKLKALQSAFDEVEAAASTQRNLVSRVLSVDARDIWGRTSCGNDVAFLDAMLRPYRVCGGSGSGNVPTAWCLTVFAHQLLTGGHGAGAALTAEEISELLELASEDDDIVYVGAAKAGVDSPPTTRATTYMVSSSSSSSSSESESESLGHNGYSSSCGASAASDVGYVQRVDGGSSSFEGDPRPGRKRTPAPLNLTPVSASSQQDGVRAH